MTDSHGEYIFYADESGDHSLKSIDSSFPVFALSLCAFKKSTYCKQIIPRFLEFKFRYFGHDAVVLHERDIRMQSGSFEMFAADIGLRQRFAQDLTQLLDEARFKIFPVVINKPLLNSDMFPSNPYSISLKICLQMAYMFLKSARQHDNIHHFIFEKRGRKEDGELELEFRRIADGENDLRTAFPGFRIHFSDKRTNSTGMQVADLTARPIALSVIRPDQANRAFEIIRRKLFKTQRFNSLTRGIVVP